MRLLQILLFVAISLNGFTQKDSVSKEYHVSVNGNDVNDGSVSKPFKTIMAAANVAMPGDIITVHAGTYRESINPPRGGESDSKRITYQSANGEKVQIKGSEVIKNWIKVNDQAWKIVIPSSFFGKFNPFNDFIKGDWYVNIKKRKLHTGAVYLNGHWLSEARSAEEVLDSSDCKDCWYANVNEMGTTIFANFGNKNPNEELVEINVRQTIFYPQKTGINYISVKGFSMTQAATPWAPPTAEQKAIIGTNWSQGWIIENNDISYSICSGISLGKYGDQYDNTSANSAEGYVKTVERALQNGWNKETIGHHIVRNNVVSHCEQAGIVGSLGCAFSTVSNNVVHDIHVMKWYFGYEMAGIKFHGAVDAVINKNHIYNCNRGIWIDWMAQGTMVTNNLLHNNDMEMGYDQADIYLEVNHGPAVVANNFFLSERSILNRSNGTAFVHNLITGSIVFVPEKVRETPFLKANSTLINGLTTVKLGDDRWLNNIVSGKTSFDVYEDNTLPVMFTGNVLFDGATASRQDKLSLTDPSVPNIKITKEPDGFYLEINVNKNWAKRANTKYVTTELLGPTVLSQQRFENPDGSPLSVSTDYFGKRRKVKNPSPGPFEIKSSGKQKLKVW